MKVCTKGYSTRLGLSVVELLIAIAILGLLVALLLPALQAARESSRRAICLNNLRQLTVATQGFHQNNSSLPYYFCSRSMKDDCRGEPEGGWFLYLTPHLDRGNVYEAVRENGGALGQQSVLVAPASPDYSPGHWVTPAGCRHVIDKPARRGKRIIEATTSHNGHSFPQIKTTSATTDASGHWECPPGVVRYYVPEVGTPARYRYVNRGLDAVTDVDYPVLQCLSDPSTVGPRQHVQFRHGPGWSLTNYQANYHVFARQCVHWKRTRIPEITDGLSNTILFAEGMRLCDGTYRIGMWSHYQHFQSHNLGVDWNGNINTYMFQSRPHPRKCNNWRAQGLHFGQLAVAFADGSTRTLSPQISRREISDPDQPQWGVDADMGKVDGVWDQLLLPNYGGGMESYF